MFDAGNHIIHLSNGRLAPASTTTNDDVRRIAKLALDGNASSGIVIHFHGGLVGESKAREGAEHRLYPLYAERSQAYPVFFIWESGPLETVRNNLRDIAHEDLFQEFVKKAAEWVLKTLPFGTGFKGAGGANVDEPKLRGEFDEWFRGERGSPPEQLERVPGTTRLQTSISSKGAAVDERALEENITESIEGDPDFQEAVQKAYNGLHPGGATRPSTKGVGTMVSETSLISKDAADRLFEPQTGTTKGFGPVSWFKAAKMVVSIVRRCIGRFRGGRDHGMYATLVEETLRELYLDKLGRSVWWNQMKKDTADAFEDGTVYGGTAFLAELHMLVRDGRQLPRITLVGHSAGAIHALNFLKAANHWLPDQQFDVIFEAPAATHAMFADTLQRAGTHIRNFRQFGMSDALEAADTLVPVIYTSSLLYFVSGLLEDDADEPLIGMERYVKDAEIYGVQAFPHVDSVQKFYARFPKCLVWSPHAGEPGFNSEGRRHGDFDDADEATMGSVEHILRHGFQ